MSEEEARTGNESEAANLEATKRSSHRKKITKELENQNYIMESLKKKKRAYEERNKQRTIQTLSGNVTVVHPVEAVTLGQAVVVVAGNKIYFIAGLWNKMSKEEAQGANEGAFAGKQWIEDHPVADTMGNDMRALHGGAACCEHTGFPHHLVKSIKEGRALIFGRVKPHEQMADSITVGTVGSSLPKCEVCTKWSIHKGVVPRFRKDGTI